MANETTYASLSDSRLSEILAAEYDLLLASRTRLADHPALLYGGSITNTGSNVIKRPFYGLDGYVLPGSESDAATVANTVLADDKFTVTVARYSKAYAPTDLAVGTDPFAVLTPQRLVQDAVVSSEQRLVALIAALAGGFSTVVGSSGGNMTLQNFMDAKASLDINDAEGAAICMLHPRQWHDLLADLSLNSGGGIIYTPATAELTRIRGNGYQGQLMGVDVWTSTRIPTANAGADRAGGMFVRGAIQWADMQMQSVVTDPTSQIAIGNVLFERERIAAQGVTQYVTHTYLGAAECLDLAGVSIITDA
jgi:hypothetical protein